MHNIGMLKHLELDNFILMQPTAYLEGYQKYPKGEKAPINLLKLGVSMVQIGEKEQGCKMIEGVEKQYPKANQSVLQKAKYESKKFECSKQNS